MSKINEFILAANQCADQCCAMIEHEKEKRQALLSGDEKRLEQALQTMQADMMRLEQLEKRRLQKQAEAGFEGLAAGEILERLDGNSPELAEAFDRLKKAAGLLKEYNAKAQEIAKGNVQLIEMLERKRDPAGMPTYRPGGQSDPDWDKGRAFTKKI